MVLQYEFEEAEKPPVIERSGMLVPAEMMDQMGLLEFIDRRLPEPGNRGFAHSQIILPILLKQLEGLPHLTDVDLLNQDEKFCTMMEVAKFPDSRRLGDGLRRIAGFDETYQALRDITTEMVRKMLNGRTEVTLDIDATFVESGCASAERAYNGKKGFMPLVCHIDTGQILHVDFRKGNVSPAKGILPFLKDSIQVLPSGVRVGNLRLDAAGYQAGIIAFCDQQDIHWTIRAKRSPRLKKHIKELHGKNIWKPFICKDGSEHPFREVCSITHWITGYDRPFRVVLDRTPRKSPQRDLDLEDSADDTKIEIGDYHCRAIATSRMDLTSSEVVHYYNQRGEDSENRLKEQKRDMCGDTLPCSEYDPNKLYFCLSGLSYNLFHMTRNRLMPGLESQRAPTIRKWFFNVSGTLVNSGRQRRVRVYGPRFHLLHKAVQLMRGSPLAPLPA